MKEKMWNQRSVGFLCHFSHLSLLKSPRAVLEPFPHKFHFLVSLSSMVLIWLNSNLGESGYLLTLQPHPSS